MFRLFSARAMRLRTFAAMVATLLFLVSALQLSADVIGEFDVLPVGPTDLPIDGGMATGDVIVGDTDVGILTIDIPAFTLPLESPNGFIGNTVDGDGLATVTGFISEWRLDDKLSIGTLGLGQLKVLDGARVSTGNGVTSTGSEIFIGEMVDTISGVLHRSSGEVFIDGFGSRILTETLYVGNEGDGYLEITGRALVDVVEIFIAEEADSTGKVILDGQGTRMLVEELIEIGHTGRAVMEVRNRAYLRSEDVEIGIDPDSYGKATIKDLGTQWWVDNDMTIGNPASTVRSEVHVDDFGLLRVQGVATVTTAGLVELGGGVLLTPTLSNAGIVRGRGRIEAAITNVLTGEIRNFGEVGDYPPEEALVITSAVSSSGLIESLGGEMEFESTVTNETVGVILARDALMRFNAGLTNSGNLALGGDTTVYGPISGSGNITVLSNSEAKIVGDLTLSGLSTLSLTIGDSAGTLDVIGGVELGSATLALDYSSGVLSQGGDSYAVLSSSEPISGSFSNAQAIADDRLWDITGQGTDTIFVTASGIMTGTISADFDSDGHVDGSDFLTLQRGFGLGTTFAEGDATLNSTIDGLDHTIWEMQYSTGGPILAPVAAVPEPASALMVMLGVVAFTAGATRPTIGRCR